MKRIYLLLGLGLGWMAVGVVGCAGVSSTGVPPVSGVAGTKFQKPLPAPPVITQSFASAKLRPGETWRVYLIASGPDEHMKNIVSIISQPGVGVYPVSITRINWDGRREFNGYIYLATSAFRHLDFASLTLTVQIQDTAGQYSKPVEFRLSFNDLYQQEPPPPGIFKDHDLGPIMINVHGFREHPLGHFPF